MLEHPIIASINRTGYPENMVAQPEHCGIDFFSDEILAGDEVVYDEEQKEVILKDNLERYLAEQYGFTFKTIE